MKLTTSAVLGAAVMSAGLVGAIAPSASAATTTQHNYVHFPGSFAKTQGECLTSMHNFENAVRRDGGTVGGSPVTSDSELTSCFVTAKGWTYDVAYMRSAPMFKQDMAVNGGFKYSSIVGGLKLTQAQAQAFAAFTSPNFELRKAYPTMAACQAAFKPVNAKLTSMAKAGQIAYSTPGPENEIGQDVMPSVTYSCSSSDLYDLSGTTNPVQYGFDVQWEGPTNIAYPGLAGAHSWDIDQFHSTYTNAAGQQVMAGRPEVTGQIAANGIWAQTS